MKVFFELKGPGFEYKEKISIRDVEGMDDAEIEAGLVEDLRDWLLETVFTSIRIER